MALDEKMRAAHIPEPAIREALRLRATIAKALRCADRLEDALDDAKDTDDDLAFRSNGRR